MDADGVIEPAKSAEFMVMVEVLMLFAVVGVDAESVTMTLACRVFPAFADVVV